MNALHQDAHLELSEVWDDFQAAPNLWVAIFTGAGDRAFCAGNDLKQAAAQSDQGDVPRRERMAAALLDG